MHETRDLAHIYKGQQTVIPAVTGDFCPACGEAVLDTVNSVKANMAILAFNRRVDNSLSPISLRPPRGYSSWLDYAVATMDTRSLEAEAMFDDTGPNWPAGATRAMMIEAAREELRLLRRDVNKVASDEMTLFAHENGEYGR